MARVRERIDTLAATLDETGGALTCAMLLSGSIPGILGDGVIDAPLVEIGQVLATPSADAEEVLRDVLTDALAGSAAICFLGNPSIHGDVTRVQTSRVVRSGCERWRIGCEEDRDK